MSAPNHLPPGWSVSNSSGNFTAPAAPVNGDAYFAGSDDESVGGVPGLTEEDLRPDSPGWDDVEDDSEAMSYKCLVCDETLSSVRDLVMHGKEAHDLDLDRIRKHHYLDFYTTLQLVNYIRTQVQHGATTFDFATSSTDNKPWADEKFLQPVMEDDALLYSIDELADPDDPDDPLAPKAEEGDVKGGEGQVGEGQRVLAERAVR